MSDIITYVFCGFAVVVLLIALSYFFDLKKNSDLYDSDEKFNGKKVQKDENGNTVFVRCPICNSPFAKGENMYSRVYRPMNVPDQRMTVQGCPHCYPVIEMGLVRMCPVCHRQIPLQGYLMARLFNLKSNKKHVIVTGCSECYKH